MNELTVVTPTPPPSEPVKTLSEAVSWLEQEAHRIIRASRRQMKDGTAAFPPQVGIGYEAFWLRDFEYALEGSIGSFSRKELTDACRLFVRGVRADGAGVDCVKFDGTPIYKPGYGTMGREPVADGPQFTVGVVWHTYRKTQDAALLKECLDTLIKAMNYLPRGDGCQAGVWCGPEWSAEWTMEVRSSERENRVRIVTAIGVRRLSLAPGETIEFPPLHLGTFTGGLVAGSNALRRYIYQGLQPRYRGQSPYGRVSYSSYHDAKRRIGPSNGSRTGSNNAGRAGSGTTRTCQPVSI